MTIARYANYRASGIDWQGDVPAHWDVAPLKAHYTIVGGATPKSDQDRFWDGDIPWVTPADLSRLETPFISTSIRTITEEGLNSCAASVLPPESIVLSTRAPIGSLGIAAVPLATNQGCKGLVPKVPTSSAPFLAYVLSVATEQLNVRGKGTTFLELSGDELARFKIAFPPADEQAAIAGFLDRETGKIDALVKAQRRLIDLLKEKRQAVISHAVTKGLDPAATMKDSGVEWLGEVPAHWPIRRFSAICAVAEGQVDPREEPYRSMVLIAPNHIEADTGHLHDLETAADQGAESGKYQVKSGDVIYSKIRPALAKVAVAPCDGLCSADMYPLRARADTHGPYLKWLMLSPGFTAWAVLASDRVAMPKINREKLNSLLVPVPTLAEQEAIAASIEESCSAIDQLIARSVAGITLLKERRSALISAAVTGKFEVRRQRPAPAAADQATARRLVGATVLELVADTPASGRMTSAKRMYLAQAHAGVWELRSEPQRMAAGPFDSVLMGEVEAELARVGHISTSQPNGPSGQVHYRLTGARGALRAELDALLGDRRTAFDKMLADLGELESKGVEAVATLYAVWNDMLIDGGTPSDDAVIDGVLNDWHAEKRDKFTKADLRNYLGWMDRHGMTPTGRGPRTKSGALL